MLSSPGDPKVYNRCIPLICLGLVGLLHILLIPFLPSVLASAEKPETGVRVAILPFENMSGEFFDIDDMMKPFYQKMGKIFSLSPIDEVDEVILQLRLRHTGFLSSQEALEIGQRLGVKAIIFGMICLYQETPEPRIGLIMKVIGTGEGTPLLWATGVSKSGNLTESWFGRNRIRKADSLIDKVAEDLVKEIPIHIMQKDDDFE